MRTTISSALTFFYKFIFPVLWSAVFGLAGYWLFNGPYAHSAMGSAPIVFAAAWVVGTAFLLATTLPILRVQIGESCLFISNYRSELELLPGDIASVTQSRWSKFRPVTIHLRNDSRFGRNLRFLPRYRFIFAFWNEDPIVGQLRRWAGVEPARD